MTNFVLILSVIAFVAFMALLVGRKLDYQGYWLNHRRSTLMPLVATTVATQVGAGTTLGIAASTAEAGTGYGLVAVLTTFVGFLAIPSFVRRIVRASETSGEFTLTGLYRWYFGRWTGLVASIVTFLGYLGLLAGQLVAGAALVETITALSWGQAIAVSGVTVVIYSAYAGLKGDFVTDQFLFVFMGVLLFLTLYVLWTTLSVRPELVYAIPAETWSPVGFGGYTYLLGGLAIGALIPIISLEMWLRVFSSDQAEVAKTAFRWSGVLIVPFYLAPMLAGAVAVVAIDSAPGSQTVLVDLLESALSPTIMAVVYVGLIATIISTTNTLQLVLGAVAHRDILPNRRESIKSSRLASLVVGLMASGAAYFVRDIVDLVLSGFFYIVLLGPLFLEVAWRQRTEEPPRRGDLAAAGALVAGVLVMTVGSPFVGVGAVLGGFATVCLILWLSRTWRART